MKSGFLFFVFTLLVHICKAQKIVIVPPYGKIDVSELRMQDCSFEPGVSAINLLKYEDVTLDVGDNGYAKVVTTIRYRIKIFKSGGFKYANIVIPYGSGNDSKISNVQGTTYNLDANTEIQATPLKDADIYKNTSSKNDDERSIKFAFPDVKEGSVLEYQYTITEKNSFLISSWYFQNNIPNLLSACKISRPYFSEIQQRVVAGLPVEQGSEIDDSKADGIKRLNVSYAMRNIPSFKPEPFMSSSRDYKYHIEFLVNPKETFNEAELRQSNNQWMPINFWLLYYPYFGGQFDYPIPNTKGLIDSVRRLKQTGEKINAVYEYVKRNIKWNNYYFILSRNLDEVWKDKQGTSAEINLSILNLLRRCDVQSYPVLFSTRYNGLVNYDFPSPGQFNTVDIVAVNGNKFCLLDGTNPYLSYQTIPYNVANRTGMIIDRLNMSKINVDFGRRLISDSVSVIAAIDSNGILKGSVVKTYFELAKIEKLEVDKEDAEDDVDVLPGEPDLKIDSSFQLNKDNVLLPLIENSKFHYELPETNNFYFLNPFLFSNLSSNPFKDSTRTSDIDFGANTSYKVHMEIRLSKQIKLEDLAKDKNIQLEDSTLSFNYSNDIKNDVIYINSSFEINKPIFEKENYASVKKFFEDVYSLLNNQILLQRKEE